MVHLQYRVWVVRNNSRDRELLSVHSPWHGAVLIEALAQSDLLDPSVTDNGFGLEYQETDGQWYEWYSGNDEPVDFEFGHEVNELALRAESPPDCRPAAVARRQ